LADFYVEDPVAFQDLDATPEMPRHLDAVDVKERRCHSAWTRRPQAAYGYCHDGIRCGARAARELWSRADCGEIGGQVGQPVGDQKLRIERDQVRNLWRPNGAVLSIPGRQRRNSN
jgi:hypothetical protein